MNTKISGDGLAMFIEQEKERAYHRGLREAQSIQLGESGYGSTHSAYVCVEFKGFQELRNAIRDRRWERRGDNPGQAYMGTCELIHLHRSDYGRTALLLCATHYDI